MSQTSTRMFGTVFGPPHPGVRAPSARPSTSHCRCECTWPAQMMSHEHPFQLLPPDFRKRPKGAPAMPFLVSDRAVFCRNVTVCDDDMWPNFARSHSTIACGLLELHGAP